MLRLKEIEAPRPQKGGYLGRFEKHRDKFEQIVLPQFVKSLCAARTAADGISRYIYNCRSSTGRNLGPCSLVVREWLSG